MKKEYHECGGGLAFPPKTFLIQFKQDKKVMKEFQVEAMNVREATAIALNIVGSLIYWNEIKVETL